MLLLRPGLRIRCIAESAATPALQWRMRAATFMLRPMDAVVALHPHRSSAAVRTLLAQAHAGAELLPMYPGATDSDGQRWYLLSCKDAAQLPALLAQLQQHADVDAAYLKPAGAAP